MEGLKGAMEVGSAMTILAARTGESIQSLMVLQRAFETAGVGADMMGIMVNRLQKAISGVNDSPRTAIPRSAATAGFR